MRDHEISQHRACRLVGVDPKTVRCERPPDNPEIREEMKAVAAKRRRFGYRRIGVMLERKGMVMNHKKLYRLYTEEKLGVRRRRGRKRARGTRTPMPEALRPGKRWSLDFLSDTFGASRRFRILAVNDDCCRENLCLMADTSISGARVARELDALVRLYGKALQMKLAVNTYLGGLVTGLFEAFNFARTADLDLPTFAKVLEAGPMSCDLMRMKLPKLLSEDYAPQGSIRQACNNMKMIVDEGARMGAPMRTSQVMLDLVEEAARAGWQDEDMIAMTKVLARSNV